MNLYKLNQDDLVYFENQQRYYNQAILFLNNKYDFLRSYINLIDESNNILPKIKDEIYRLEVREIPDCINKFINNIINYFDKNYNLNKINNEIILEKFIKNKYEKEYNKNITFEDVIKEIHSQFPNKSFNDLSKETMLNNMKNIFKYSEININGYKIIIKDFLNYSTHILHDNLYNLSYYFMENIKNINLALGYIETNQVKELEELNKWIASISNSNFMPENKFFNIHRFESINGLEGFKFYKNKRLDIIFNDKAILNKFYKIIKGDVIS